MVCGCDRIIITDTRVTGTIDSKFLANDGNLYLDLSTTLTFDQIDSLIELDPLGDMKTEAVFGGSVPQTDKNYVILNRFVTANQKEQNQKPLSVLAMNGHKVLNVTNLSVIYFDESSKFYELELTRGDDHWAVCAANLKLNTLDLESYEFSKELIKESWENYRYEDGDQGIYFPLANYGTQFRQNKWTVEDFRPAHSIPHLLKKGFCQCGWDFSSPVFDTDIGSQLWLYCLGEDYGKEPDALEAMKFHAFATNDTTSKLGNDNLVSIYNDSAKSYFKGHSKYYIKFEIDKIWFPEQFRANIITEVHIIISKTSPSDPYFKEEIETLNVEYPQDTPPNAGQQPQTLLVEWESKISTSPQDNISIEIQYSSFQIDHAPISDLDIPYEFTYYNEPIRTIYKRGDTVDIAKIISEDLTLLKLLKGTVHLFGQAKIYINHATKEMIMYPPFKTKWKEEEIEGFFKYDEVINLSEDLLCDTTKITAPELTTSRYNVVGFKTTRNPKVQEYLEENNQEHLHARNVDFGTKFTDETEEVLNPVFESVLNTKLIKPSPPRPPLLPEGTSDGIDCMWLVDNLDGQMSYNIGFVPFIAYGSYTNYGENIGSNFLFYSFFFEDTWEDTPVSGQLLGGQLNNGENLEVIEPALVYGEYPLKDLFSTFWREEFYRRALSSTIDISVNFKSNQLVTLDYRKLFFIQYQEGFAAWLNTRNFNYCSPEGTKLTFVPDLSIEPECIDPDTIPPVESCEEVNDPEIQYEIDENCMVSYSQVGTIESNVTSEQWLIRYEGEATFSNAPVPPFKPENNFYLRYTAETDSELCSIPTRTEYITICQTNEFQLEILYDTQNDCYQINTAITGCNEYSDVQFYTKAKTDPDTEYVEVEPENPLDDPEDYYIKVCEPESNFCVKVVPTILTGCEIDEIIECIDLCPTSESVICDFIEVEGGFNFNPNTEAIHRIPTSELYEYDIDENFSNPVEFALEDTLNLVGKFYFRATLTFEDCDPVVKICEYTRDSSNCSANKPDFQCNVLPDGRLIIEKTGTLVSDPVLDRIAYSRSQNGEWIDYNGEKLSNCPIYVKRNIIFCNDCPPICVTARLCNCSSPPNPEPFECADFYVVLKRYQNELYAEVPFTTSGMVFIFYKDGEEIQNSSSNTITLSGSDGTYRVKAIFSDCEDQDDFVYDSGCEVPELTLGSKTNDGMTYSYVFNVVNAGANPQFTVYLEYQTGEATTSTKNIDYTYNEGLGTISIEEDLYFGNNRVVITVENSCGTDIITNLEHIQCPEVDTGQSNTITICQGCLGNEDAINYIGGTPDEGGTWFDLSSSGQLENDGSINFHLLGLGTYEFLYTFNAESDLCRRSSQLTVNVIERKLAGDSVVLDLCHDAGETELFSLIPNSPDSGGSWYSDSAIAGDLDLVNGTITPSAADIGQEVVISYTHDPEVTDGCSCLEFSIITINIIDCTPAPACVDDSGLGIDISEIVNGSPSDQQWEDKLNATKTGSYANASIIDTDEIYFSNDDGATWIQATEVKDDDYYVKLTFDWDATCNFSAQTSMYRIDDVILSNGDNVDEATVVSGNGSFNNSWTNITPATKLELNGPSSSFFAERYFRWDIKHVLNSGWELQVVYTAFIENDGTGQSCAPGGSPYLDRYNSGFVSGKRKILFERRITYNNGCAPLTIEEEFNPTLPDCVDGTPSGVGFSITPPVDLGGGSYYSGYVRCQGSIAGSTSDTIRVYEQYSGSGGYATTVYTCGSPNGSNNDLAINNSYFFTRIIEFADCPPIILLHNYQAPAGCSTAGITCSKEDANSRAKAIRSSTPSIVSGDYLQYKIGAGSWNSYTEGQWVYVSGTQTVYFRRIANYNNGCSQTTSSCSTTVTPPTVTITNTCSGGEIVNTSISGIAGGGLYRVYKNGTFVSQSGSNSYTTTDAGTYRVDYVKDGQTYTGNSVTCGSSSGGCLPPTISVGSCQISGNNIVLPFSTSNITGASQIFVSSSAGTGTFTFNTGTGQGQVNIAGEPGLAHTITVSVENDCGDDEDERTCTLGCSTLLFDNVICDFDNGHVTYDVLLSPDGGGIPTSNGTYLSKPSTGRYRYRYTLLTGNLTADHNLACSPISQAINCECDEPIIDLNLSCNNNSISYSFTVANESSVNGDYEFMFDNNPALTFVVSNTSSGSYSGNWSVSGLSHTYKLSYEACGEEKQITGSMTCSCANPSISLTASCDTDEVDINFTVTNESQATSNYSVVINGAVVKTITKTGAGAYTDTIAVTSGTNNLVQIRVNSACGGQVSSNTASANCGCPSSSLSITGVSCDPETQMLTFSINQTNITGAILKVNGVTKTITSNPMSIQGQIGSNTINVIGEDSCSGDDLSDTVVYTCDCDLPTLSFSASCNTSGVISYTLNVTNEDRVDGNYTILRDGAPTNTISNTGAGTYTGTINVTPGTSRTMRVTAPNECGGVSQSNLINVSCGCPSSSLSIDSVSCNPGNQNITFSLNRSNVTDLVLKVNGLTISPIPPNPITVAGQIGANTISATAKDSCDNDPLSDSETINCACTNDPTVSITGDSESGGVITVTFSTTNISNSGQINFVANGNAIGSKTNLGGGNWSVSFNAISGTNNYSVTVTNPCGSDSDSDSTNYVPCVAPTITKINQGVNSSGQFYVNFSTTNCTSISAPSAIGTVNCSSSQVRWSVGSSVLNWSITVTNACGSDMISGSFDPCEYCSVSIVDLGCESINENIDFVFLVDHSASISFIDFEDAKDTILNTIQLIHNSGGGSYRYAVAEYHQSEYGAGGYYSSQANDIMFVNNPVNGDHFVSYAEIYNAIYTWSRYENTCAYLPYAFVGVLGKLTGNAPDGRYLNLRPSAKLHVIIIHDTDSTWDNTNACSSLGALSHRNNFLNWFPDAEISVVQYEDSYGPSPSRGTSAAIATIGGTWTSPIASNPNDPQGNPLQGPKRMYYRTSYDGQALTDLVADALQECQLRVNLSSGCPWTIINVDWTTSGGSIIEDNGVVITTNGSGSYTADVTLSNGCNIEKTFSYPAMLMMRSVSSSNQGSSEEIQTGKVSKANTRSKKVEQKKASEYIYDFSKLTKEQENELLELYRQTKTAPDPSLSYKNIMTFMNRNVKSDYYFSCGCDSGEIDIILNKWIQDGGMEL